ncbi:hypothetical protein [Zooshikella sp. RANM57]|uniref:hypothetical protein n=1 Tax=Zooshikella sp. RANM57 TaxID=3425863 RepID=UPI003D6DB6C0
MTPEQYQQLLEGIPEDLHDEFNEAYSLEHAFQIKGEIQDALKVQDDLMAHGPVVGIGAALAASIADPAAIGLTMATEGLAAPALIGMKANRLRRIIAAGLASSASAAVVEGSLAAMDPTIDSSDVLISMAGAFVLGSAVSTYRTRFDGLVDDYRRALELEQFRQAGGELDEKGRKYYARFLDEDGNMPSPDDTNSRLARTLAQGDEISTTFGAIRADRAGINYNSDMQEVREISAKLFTDSLGGGGQKVEETASLWKRMTVDKYMVRFNKSLEKNFNNYLRDQGKSTVASSLKHNERLAFNELVTRAVRGEAIDNPYVQAHAATAREIYSDVLTLLKNPAGRENLPNAVAVKGADEVNYSDTYINRRWSAGRLVGAIQREGYSNVQSSIARSFHNVDGDAAMELAGAVMDIVISSKKEVVHLPALNKLVDENMAEYLMRELGLDADKAVKTAKIMKKAIKRNDSGKVSNLKSRIDLDESKITAYLENDSELLIHNYLNSMVGHAALARQGFESESAFKAALDNIKKARDYSPGKNKRQQTRYQLEIKNLQDAYDHLVGRPIDVDPSSTWSRANRVMRKMQFARVMNQVGFAQLMEIGNLLSHVGLKATLQHVPSLRYAFSRMDDGAFRDALQEELSDAIGGWCNGRSLHTSTVRTDEFNAAYGGNKSTMDSVENALDQMNKLTADLSGFHAVNSLLQNLAMKGMAQRFLDYAKKGRKIMSKKRLRELGIDDELLTKISREFEKADHVNGKLTRMNFHEWDPDVYAKFSYSMRSWGSRIIQEQDFGDGIPYLMTKELGKTLLQFRTFMITAYSKQLLHSMKHRDMQTFSFFMFTTAFSGLVYTMQTHVQAVGLKNKEEFLERRLSPEAIAKASFQRSSYASIFPMLIDSFAEIFTGDPYFGARTTELATNLWTGNASYDFLQKSVSSFSAMSKAMLRDDYNFNQEDWYNTRSIIPFQNTLIIQQALKNIGAEFPRY